MNFVPFFSVPSVVNLTTEGTELFTEKHRANELQKLYRPKKLGQMKIRLRPINVVPHQVMRVRQIIAAFKEIHFTFLVLYRFEFIKAEYLYGYRNRQCPVYYRFAKILYLF